MLIYLETEEGLVVSCLSEKITVNLLFFCFGFFMMLSTESESGGDLKGLSSFKVLR